MELSLWLGVVLVSFPLLLSGGIAYAIRETPVRSEEAAEFAHPPTPFLVPLAVGIVAAGLYAVGSQSRAESFFLLLIALSLFGAGFVERKLLVVVSEIMRYYVNPAAWLDGTQVPGPRWRYQMRARYVHDPEYVDQIALDMMSRFDTFADFEQALERNEFPTDYDARVLDSKPWGPAFGTARHLVKDEVIGQVLHTPDDHRFKPKNGAGEVRSAEDIFDELRELMGGKEWKTLGDEQRRRLLDRWQYYWTLRNMNRVDAVLEGARGSRTVLGVILAGALLFFAGAVTISDGAASAELALQAQAAGALLWLILVCGGASVLIIGVFRGTGTFSIARPTRGLEFDPLWNQVIQVGILAFAVSFMTYGIGGPFLLDPETLTEFAVDAEFLAFAAGTFLFCMFVFVVHTVGVHNLMRASKDNALDRISEDLRSAGMNDQETLDHFREVRHMRVWPLRASTVFQLAGGILVPIAVQGFLIYVGLER